MADPSKIEWTDATWNLVTGCTKVSPGCAHCYAERLIKRFGGDFSKVTLHPDRLEEPLHWRRPRRVFVVSMGDLFHEDVPDDFIASVFLSMAVCAPSSLVPGRRHTFQVLTKRAARMRAFVENYRFPSGRTLAEAPLPNVWLGVTVENQRMADERIPLLLETPAAVRFISAEPLLGPLDLVPWFRQSPMIGGFRLAPDPRSPGIDWVIAGGESGGPERRRLVERCELGRHLEDARGGSHPCGWRPKPEALAWVRSIRDQCQAAGVPLFFKQWGGPRPKSGGALLDGREWREMPIREAVTA